MAVVREGAPVALEPKALDVLLFLIDHRDRLVTKDELLDVVWKDTFVTPNVLTRAVAQLRKALGDDADDPTIIETVAKRGYRFVATVTEGPTSDAEPAAPVSAPVDPPRAATGVRRAHPFWLAMASALIATGVTLFMAHRARAVDAAARREPEDIRQVTTRAGYNAEPSLSPDGRSFAYVSDRTGALEIYVRGLLLSGVDQALTSDGGQNMQPQWSPDGQWIAYHSQKRGGVWVVPSSGGQAQQITEFGSAPAWSPDGSELVFSSDAGGFAAQSTLWIVRRDGSARREVTSTRDTPGGATDPSWSHNGKLVAFTSRFQGPTDRPAMYVLSLADSKIHRVAAYPFQRSPRFSIDDRELYWTAVTNQSATSLLRIPISPENGDPLGPPQPVHSVAGSPQTLSISRDGTLAIDMPWDDDNLWEVPLGTAASRSESVRLTNESARVSHPTISVTGDIAFSEWVPGQALTAWLRRPDGTTEQLLPSTPVVCPEFSPDGTRAFVLGAQASMWVDLATRRTTPLPFALNALNFPRLSPDNTEVAYHKIGEDGRMALWIRSMAGGNEQLLAEDAEGVGFVSWSPDGQTLAVELKRGDQTHLGLLSRKTQRITPFVTERGNSWPNDWSPSGKTIAYAGEREGVWNVWIVDVATGVSRALTHFTLPVGYVRYPVFSAKGDRLVFERAMRTSTIWTMQVK